MTRVPDHRLEARRRSSARGLPGHRRRQDRHRSTASEYSVPGRQADRSVPPASARGEATVALRARRGRALSSPRVNASTGRSSTRSTTRSSSQASDSEGAAAAAFAESAFSLGGPAERQAGTSLPEIGSACGPHGGIDPSPELKRRGLITGLGCGLRPALQPSHILSTEQPQQQQHTNNPGQHQNPSPQGEPVPMARYCFLGPRTSSRGATPGRWSRRRAARHAASSF